jgi:hypothetical protein
MRRDEAVDATLCWGRITARYLFDIGAEVGA